MAGAEPSDTGVVRLPIAGDEPKRNIDLAALFDLAAGEHTQAVGVQKQREDHARVVAGPASRFATSCGERSQIETGDRVEHCPGKWSSGSHSRGSGGDRNGCSSSHGMLLSHNLYHNVTEHHSKYFATARIRRKLADQRASNGVWSQLSFGCGLLQMSRDRREWAVKTS
jgi:hypothetical protein